ncbi:NUDIX domain-containing protein [Nannocystis pusilla]|uniref:NUDIX domain-containing protein n=1 Tax=Nannocystis pusilla TaxID=889268 RepID=UPI003B8221F3
MQPRLIVAAGLVWLGPHRLLVQRRPAGARHGAGALELPGGKVEPGESRAPRCAGSSSRNGARRRRAADRRRRRGPAPRLPRARPGGPAARLPRRRQPLAGHRLARRLAPRGRRRSRRARPRIPARRRILAADRESIDDVRAGRIHPRHSPSAPEPLRPSPSVPHGPDDERGAGAKRGSPDLARGRRSSRRSRPRRSTLTSPGRSPPRADPRPEQRPMPPRHVRVLAPIPAQRPPPLASRPRAAPAHSALASRPYLSAKTAYPREPR